MHLAGLPTLYIIPLMAIFIMGCGSERVFSGTWRQTECGSDEQCGVYRYELNLGRYGEAVTGVLVRYEASAANSFDKPYECGCFVLAGGRANKSGLDFSVLDPALRCASPRAQNSSNQVATDIDCRAPCECEGLSFQLIEEGDALVGQKQCKGQPKQEIRFVQFSGTVRNSCAQALDPASTP